MAEAAPSQHRCERNLALDKGGAQLKIPRKERGRGKKEREMGGRERGSRERINLVPCFASCIICQDDLMNNHHKYSPYCSVI